MSEILENTVARLATFISENYSDIETGPGSVINELLIKLAAAVQNKQYNLISELLQSNSVSSVLSSGTDTYSPVLDAVASNYNTVRHNGAAAAGKLKITVSSDAGYVLREGFKFLQLALNLEYALLSEIRVSSKPVAALDELQLFSADGLYYFIVDVVASGVGAEYQVPSGTVFSLYPKNFISGLVKIEAYGSFSSGASKETDRELVANFKNNLGNTRFESAAGIAHNFKNTFSGFQTLSVCGANDNEMLRSKQNVLGISTFGKADVYVRSSVGLETRRITKSATKIADNTWQVLIDNSDAPGFYTVKSIIPVTVDVSLGGTLVPTSTDFGWDIYSGQRNNEIHSRGEARFTKYQTATVTFTYTEVPTAPIKDKALFELSLTGQPNIKEMQDLLLGDAQRLACADYLVKAVVPCMVSFEISLTKKTAVDTYESLNLQQLKKDIFMYVNTLPFGEELHASNIVDLCHNYKIKRVNLPLRMTGIVLPPDGPPITITSTDVLYIPNRPDIGVTPKTALYFTDYYRIESGVANPIDNIGLSIA